MTTLGEEHMTLRPPSEQASVEKGIDDLIERLLRANPGVSRARGDAGAGLELSPEQKIQMLEATLAAQRQAILRLARAIDELRDRQS